MDSTTRRGLLRGMAALPAFAALSGCRGFGAADNHEEEGKRQTPKDNQPFTGQLNVCLHGLWFVQVCKEGFILHAPTVADHVYRAGWWKQETELDPKVSSFELKGLVHRRTAPAIDDLRHPVLRATATPNRALMSTVIKVPFPDEVHGLRCVRRAQTDAPFFADGKYSPRPDLMFLPMNLILVYRPDSASKTPFLEGSTWRGPASSPYPANLHLRAEPLKMSLMDAQAFLCTALGITDRKDLLMNERWKKSPPPPVDPVKPLYGYDRDEQLGLGELFPPMRSAADVWDEATFAEIPKLEGSPCRADINFAAPSNCSHIIGRC